MSKYANEFASAVFLKPAIAPVNESLLIHRKPFQCYSKKEKKQPNLVTILDSPIASAQYLEQESGKCAAP